MIVSKRATPKCGFFGVSDPEPKPETVDQLLATMQKALVASEVLLSNIQILGAVVAQQQMEIAALKERVGELERGQHPRTRRLKRN
jgi:hypothetical protein